MEELETRTTPSPVIREDVMFVALVKDENESETILSWAIRNSRGMKICILHVHQTSWSIRDEYQLRAMNEMRMKVMHQILDTYVRTCVRNCIRAEKVIIEMDSIENGILELISEHHIKWLVMGAAAHRSYSRRMKEPTSKKANRVRLEAPSFCHIWFICKGNLIYTRESKSNGVNIEEFSPPFEATANIDQINSRGSLLDNHRTQQSSLSTISRYSTSSSSKIIEESALVWKSFPKRKKEIGRESSMEGNMNNNLYEMGKAQNYRKEMHEESIRRRKAEKDAIDALGRAKVSETMYYEELRHRKELEESSARYKKERDELRIERDNVPQFFSEFSFFEIEEATDHFDPVLKVGEGGYGSIYRGKFRHTQVAIKMLFPNSLQGPSEYQQEVNILSKLRHPNIVTLIGACPDTFSLIYEYLPNGSLEDRLNCKGNTQPLSWQTRIRIAADICYALIFLLSFYVRGVVHGDLKTSNILLDANFVPKISGFGCRVLLKDDIYSFGIILLQLLTGRPALGIGKEVRCALDEGNLNDLLDSTAGDWPFVQARQLAHLGVSCCNIDSGLRPDLESEVWRVLEQMRVSCAGPILRLGSEERDQVPSYFVCPIFQEVMQDPVFSADGFTYEAEALKGWLESGHDTSPMTNLKLQHKNLVPNRALRSAIQEWMQLQ